LSEVQNVAQQVFVPSADWASIWFKWDCHVLCQQQWKTAHYLSQL